MFELLWLLLPVAAASGWWVARYNFLHKTENFSPSLFPDYFKGLNYLLNEQPDKAIDVFIKLIDVESDIVETHLALGVLFRRRGEVNRAILIHQNLVEKGTLDAQQHSLALLELAQDYRHAGLLDRAENLFLELLNFEDYQTEAFSQLLDIYQQEQDWDKAIDIAQKLAHLSEEPLDMVIAQYHCEQAHCLVQQEEFEIALQAIERALAAYPDCVRASLLEAQVALGMGDTSKAIVAFKRVEQQNPDYLSEIVNPLRACYRTIGKQEEFVAYLYHILEDYNDIAAMLTLVDIIESDEGTEQAIDFIIRCLHKKPSARGFEVLIDLVLAKEHCISHQHLLLLKDMAAQLLKDRPTYKCSQCGFSGKSLHWQCPSCKQWSTVKLIQGIDGE